MSHRNKPRTAHPRAGLAWPVVALGVILVVAAVFLLTRQGGSGGSGGAPQVAVDTQRIDYGRVKFGETRQFEINVTNTGDGALRFARAPYIEVLEGC